MKTIQVDSDMMESFASFDPFGRGVVLMLPGSFALGAVAEHDDVDEPAAVIICSTEEDSLVVEWLYTAPEFRGQGVGCNLLYLAFKEAKARGIKEVDVRISKEYEEVMPEWDVWSFFENDIFSDKMEGSFSRFIYMKDLSKRLSKDEDKNEAAAKDPAIRALKDLQKKELYQAEKDLANIHGANDYLPIAEKLQYADVNMSFVIEREGVFSGALLVRKFGETWHPFVLFAKDQDDMKLLVRAAMYHCEDHILVGDTIEIFHQKPMIEKLMDELDLPGESYKVTYLVANMDDFDKRSEELGKKWEELAKEN